MFFLLMFTLQVEAQIACPFAVPQESDVHSTWDTPPLLLLRTTADTEHPDPQHRSNTALLGFIYKNMQYPALQYHHWLDGLMVVTFIIDAAGWVDPASVRCVRTPHAAMGQEAERVIKLMTALQIQWQPATVNGRAVPVRYNVPIRLHFN